MAAHPLEQLRYVARGWGAGEPLPAVEVASVLAQLADESPSMLLQACRRIIEYFPGNGVAWWLSARVLSAPEPVEGIWEAADELADDPTGHLLADALPSAAVVVAPQPSLEVTGAMRRRADVKVVKKITGNGASTVLVSALAAGPGAVLTTPRAALVAANALASGKDVWAVVARGTLLPGPLWDEILSRVGGLPVEVLGASQFTGAVGERGLATVSTVLSGPTCPAVAELLGWKI